LLELAVKIPPAVLTGLPTTVHLVVSSDPEKSSPNKNVFEIEEAEATVLFPKYI
jgi:hypothetical protein